MRKIVFIFVAAVFLIIMGSTQGTAYKRPPNPVMNYVSQNVGIYDTYYGNFKEFDCRVCHGSSEAVSNRHHYSAFAFADCPDGCPLSPTDCVTVCHNPAYNPITNPIRDCKVCHVDGTWIPVDIGYGIGNLGYPHHRSDLAGSELCTTCHQPDLLVGTYTVRTPYYYPMTNTHTPTPYSCENCHWPSGDVPEGSPPLADWNSWTGLPKPTTWPDGQPHPAPIEANGPVTTGSVIAGDPAPAANKPYRPMSGTHHEVDGFVVIGNCPLCHANDPNGFTFDPNYPLLIRFCENCHSRDSLHSIQEHVTAGNGLTVQQKCIACHGGMPDAAPPSGAQLPVITGISPLYGPQETSCSITGKNFDTTGSIRNVLMTSRMGATDQTHIIPSGLCTWWSDDVIIFNIPSGLDPRNYSVRVETDNGTSNIRVFTLTGTQPCIPCPSQTPVIDSIEPPIGANNAAVIVRGQNFGDSHTADRDVMLVGDTYSIAAPIISWTANEIRFHFPPQQFAPGTIPVKVKTEIGESNQMDFLLRNHPSLYSLGHTDTTGIRLTGLGFGDIRESVRPDGYGWKSALTFNHPDGMIVVAPGNITSWNDTEIQLTLPALQTDSYGIAVVTRYFYDTDGNGVYTHGVDKVYQTLTSDPLPFGSVECGLIPNATHIPRGGALTFQTIITNNTNNSLSVHFATDITKPDGNRYPASGYLIGPLEVSLEPHQTKSGYKSHAIPGTAPLGTYTYHGYVGNYGAGLYDECTFTFQVIP
jgi:hypothetical protein